MSIKRIIFNILGILFLGLGLLGIVLPVLPTTPFLLLTGFCLSRGSKRFDDWFKGSSFYQKYVVDYYERGGMSISRKVKVLIMATSTIIISILVVPVFQVRIFLLSVIIFLHYYFLIRIKTIQD